MSDRRPRRHQTRARRAAFTLVELLAAAALSTLLLSAGFQILRSVARVPTTDARLAPPEWQQRLAAQLRWDLSQAVAWRAGGAGDVLVAGYNALDVDTLAVTHRPATVAYRVEPIGDARWLVREQALLDDRSSRAGTLQLVCEGVAAVALESRDPPLSRRARRARAGNEAPPPLPTLFDAVRGMSHPPARWRATVTFVDPARPPVIVEVTR